MLFTRFKVAEQKIIINLFYGKLFQTEWAVNYLLHKYGKIDNQNK